MRSYNRFPTAKGFRVSLGTLRNSPSIRLVGSENSYQIFGSIGPKMGEGFHSPTQDDAPPP